MRRPESFGHLPGNLLVNIRTSFVLQLNCEPQSCVSLATSISSARMDSRSPRMRDPAAQNSADCEFTPYGMRVIRVFPVTEGFAARHHAKLGQMRKPVNHSFGDRVA